MFSTFHTFKARALPFAEALTTHKMLKAPVEAFMQAHKRAPAAHDALVELWGGLCAPMDPARCATIMPQCVEWTMPPEFAVAVRRSAGTTTAFAFAEMAKQLTHVKDLTDDFDVRRAMVAAWKEFERRRQEANQVEEGFGCDESQSWLTLRDIGDDLSKDPDLLQKILAIAALAGRMFEKFGYQRKNVPNDDPEEAVGATVGGDIDRVLPTELAMLADADTEDMQAMKILQDRAVIQQMKGRESKTRGPLVMLLDESGSMHDGGGHGGYYRQTRQFAGRNTWAKACAVALTRIAWSENRPVVCVHFGTSVEVQAVPKDDYRAMFEMARAFLSGGTDFETALRAGIREVGDLEASGYQGADILIVTDGEETRYNEHTARIDEMDAAGIKLWTVAIGVNISKQAPVRARAERYTYAADDQLSDANTATELAEGLNEAALGNEPDLTLN